MRIMVLPGQRFEMGGKVYQVKEILSDSKYLVNDELYGGSQVITREDIIRDLFFGALRFEIYGKNIKNPESNKIATSYKYSDFSLLPEKVRTITWERYLIIKPLVSKLRTLNDVKRRIEEIQTAETVNSELEYYKYKKISVATFYRWLSWFEKGGCDIRVLVPAHDEKGGRGKSRLNEELDKEIADVITSQYLTEQRKTIQSTHNELEYRINKINRFRDEKDKLEVPHYSTLRNKILKINQHLVSRARYGKREADKEFEAVQAGLEIAATRPLEVIYIDHTPIDLFLVDEEDRMPIGRPNLTFAIDLATHYPLGFYVGFTPASYFTASECLYHSILPKDYAIDLYKDINGVWKSYGLPETLYVDNAKEFVGKSMEDACRQLGILLEYGRPGKGEDKAVIERFFGELNTMLLHELPGTSFSNLMDRKDYDPKKNAVISIQAFEEILHVFLIDLMAEFPCESLGGITPREAWEKGCREYPPAFPHNKEELLPLLGALESREIRKTGIQFYELFYSSAELARLRIRMKGKKKKVMFKYNPNDISCIFVWDVKNQHYVKVLACNQDYTKGLSLWKHKIILRVIKKKMDEVNKENLMKAKKIIESIVEKEWLKTKKTKTRKNLARFMNIKGKVYDAIRNDVEIPNEKKNKKDAGELVQKVLGRNKEKRLTAATDDPEIADKLLLKQSDQKAIVSERSNKKRKDDKREDIMETDKKVNIKGWS